MRVEKPAISEPRLLTQHDHPELIPNATKLGTRNTTKHRRTLLRSSYSTRSICFCAGRGPGYPRSFGKLDRIVTDDDEIPQTSVEHSLLFPAHESPHQCSKGSQYFPAGRISVYQDGWKGFHNCDPEDLQVFPGAATLVQDPRLLPRSEALPTSNLQWRLLHSQLSLKSFLLTFSLPPPCPQFSLSSNSKPSFHRNFVRIPTSNPCIETFSSFAPSTLMLSERISPKKFEKGTE